MLRYRLLGQPVSLKANNRGVILLTANPKFYHYIKHIESQYYWIQEKIKSQEIDITYISIKEMVADSLTKLLDLQPFKTFQTMRVMHLAVRG